LAYKDNGAAMTKVAIDLERDVHPVSAFRANASAVIKQVRDSGRPVLLTQRGRGAAVVLDVKAYQALIEENETLRDVLQGREDYRAGRFLSHDEARAQLVERYE